MSIDVNDLNGSAILGRLNSNTISNSRMRSAIIIYTFLCPLFEYDTKIMILESQGGV